MFQYYLKISDLDGPYWTMIIEMIFYIFILLLFHFKILRYFNLLGILLSITLVVSKGSKFVFIPNLYSIETTKAMAALKDIGLKVLEDLVGDRGGVGLYPGTSTIHIDTRGYRARWKSYKPATDGGLLQKAFRHIR